MSNSVINFEGTNYPVTVVESTSTGGTIYVVSVVDLPRLSMRAGSRMKFTRRADGRMHRTGTRIGDRAFNAELVDAPAEVVAPEAETGMRVTICAACGYRADAAYVAETNACPSCSAAPFTSAGTGTLAPWGGPFTLDEAPAAPIDNRVIYGERYTQIDAADRDRTADKRAALAANPTSDYAVLMHLHGLGYDVAFAKVAHA